MQIGVCLPRLKRCSEQVIALASTFPTVTPVDWLCPSTLVFDGVTTQHHIIAKQQHVQGHCLIAAKPIYTPTIWGGECKGSGWAAQRKALSQSQKVAVMENHIAQTIQRFPDIEDWDLIAGNVQPDGNLRIKQWKTLLDRAIMTNPRRSYWLDELLCTSYPRWQKIISMAADENIAGVGIQLHSTKHTNFDDTYKLLHRVLKLAQTVGVKVQFSEVGYWVSQGDGVDEDGVKRFAETVRMIGELYNVRRMAWWGLIPMVYHSDFKKPRPVSLFDADLNPTFLHNSLCK